MGVAGCGKSSVGAALAEQLGLNYLDGDHLHSAENIAKMSMGEPLTDADREPWLREIGQQFAASDASLIIGCSALRRVYRDWIRQYANTAVIFVHLAGNREVIKQRMATREGHFMPVKLLDSQFAALEPLQSDETSIVVDIDQRFASVVENALSKINIEIGGLHPDRDMS